ncbi:MAG: prenyltransferase [Deltaproteobacteria bacterium]|nr:prenyltransferase [Deltaproteobacteria bacterium]
MWIKALRIIPRVSPEEWKTLDVVSRWLIASRAAVFIMTATSCAVGGLLAVRDGAFSAPDFAACLLGLVFAHATNNLLNDLIDHKKGIDRNNYYRAQYGPHPIEHGLMSIKKLWAYIAVSGLVALLAGAWLIGRTGWITVILLGLGAFFVIFYTWPLKYMGLGEPSVILVWGPLMVGGTYFVVTGGHWSWQVAAISLAYAVGPTTVLFGKHTDKLTQDEARGVRTLPVILGEKNARMTAIGLWVFQYVLVAALMAWGILGWAMLPVFLSIPKFIWAVKIYSRPRPTEPPEELPPNIWPLFLSAVAFVYNRLFGVLFLAGLILDVILYRTGVY